MHLFDIETQARREVTRTYRQRPRLPSAARTHRHAFAERLRRIADRVDD